MCFISNTNVNAQCNDILPVTENFDVNNIGVCWQVTDGDGDGFNWYWRDYGSVYGGYKCLTSRSWSSGQGNLNPDNWVYSYGIDLTSFNTSDNITLSWKVRGELSGLAHEYYNVYAATSNQKSAFEASSVKIGEYADAVGADGVFVTRSLNISSLAGNTVYIAFRHQNISGSQFIINIDDVSINTAALSVDDFTAENFKHYYNPETENLILKSIIVALEGIELYNTLGQKVLNKKLSKSEEILNLSSLAEGIYIARISSENTTKTFKFAK